MKKILYCLIASSFLWMNSCNGPSNSTNDTFEKYNLLLDHKKSENADSIKRYIPTIDSLYKLTKDERLLWLSYNSNGIALTKQNSYQEAIIYFKKAIALSERLNIDALMAKSYNDIGICYKETGATDDAFEIYQKSIQISEKLHDDDGVARTKINLSNLYFNKGDMNLVKATLNDVIHYKNVKIRLLALHTMANYYGAQGIIDSALMIDNQVISENEGQINDLLLSPFYNNKALCFLNKGKMDSSIFFLTKSYLVDSLNGNPKNMGANLLAMAEIYQSNKEYNRALHTNQRALDIFKKVNSKKNIADTYGQISTYYKRQGNWEKALLYKDSSTTINNEINGLAINNKIEALKIEHEIYIKDGIITDQNHKLHFQRIVLAFIALLIISAIALSYFIFKVSKTKRNLQQQQVLFSASQEAQSLERERIARDLHDSVGQKLSVVKMQMSMNQNMLPTTNLLDEAIQDIRIVTHNLVSTDLSKGFVMAVQSLCDQINFSSTKPLIKFVASKGIDELIHGDQKALFIYRIIQELLNNSLKYANANNINISVTEIKDTLILTFEDDGIGFDINAIESNEGIGLKNIKKRLAQLNGSIKLASKLQKGVKFEIEIPIK